MRRPKRLLAIVVMVVGQLVWSGSTVTAANDQLKDPESATIYYSRLEARGRFARLYDYMHPDAKREVPEEVVVGWYENEFDPRDPGIATVERVEFVDWNWDVNGETYPDAAEVTYVQPFGDGTEERNTIHLVERRGEWLWFFGPSREFIDEQIAMYVDSDDGGNRRDDDSTEDEGASESRSTHDSSEYPILLECVDTIGDFGSTTVRGECQWPTHLPSPATCIEVRVFVGGRVTYNCQESTDYDLAPGEYLVYNDPLALYPNLYYCESAYEEWDGTLVLFGCDFGNAGFVPENCILNPNQPTWMTGVEILCKW